MKADTILITEQLSKGLRKDQRTVRGALTLNTCVNVRPSPFGLRSLPSILPAGTASTWPFPQLHKGINYNFLLYGSSVRYADASLAETAITTYDANAPASTKSVVSGGVWHVVDFGEYFMFLNGSCVVFRTNVANVTGADDKVFVQDDVTVQTGCKFRGRTILGGFDSSNFWMDAWKELWATWTTDSNGNPRSNIDVTTGLGGNYVWWSSVAAGDATWLFMPDPIFSGYGEGYSVSWPLVRDLLRRGQMGFMPMSWPGDVQRVLPLGGGFVVYGTGGVTAMPHIVAEGSTFGVIDLLDHGVSGRGSAGGNERGHIFIDDTGYLWYIDPLYKIEKLGYQEFFEGMDPDYLVISSDPHDNEFYISDGIKGYVLSSTGLAEVSILPTSIASLGGQLYAPHTHAGQPGFYIETDIIDCGDRDAKTIHTMEFGISASEDVESCVLHRDDKSEAFTEGTWTVIGANGLVTPVQTGNEFKVALRGPVGVELELDYIKLWWSETCKQDVGDLLDA